MSPTPEALAHRLAAIGVAGRVEAHGAVAVLTTRDPAALHALHDPAVRAAAIAAATAAGFTTLALELDDREDRAPLPRD